MKSAKRSFRDRRGRAVEPPSFSATAAKNSFGAMMDAAARNGMVAITKRDQVRAVLLSVEEYDALAAQLPDPVERLRSEFDALVAGMQTAKAKKAARSLFRATPKALGRAAVQAAAMERDGRKRLDDQPGHLRRERKPTREREPPLLETVKREHILRVLRAVGGNKAAAARILGINRVTLYRKLAEASPRRSEAGVGTRRVG